MSVFELLFGFQGRINRAQWWLGQLTALGLAAIFYTIWSAWIARYGLTGAVAKSASPSTQIMFLSSMLVVAMIISSTLVWIVFSLAIKRVHDRAHSGLWALAYGLPFLFAIIMPSPAAKAFAGATFLWYLLELGTLKGSPSHNEFGPATTVAGDTADHVDPLDLSIDENIERSFGIGRDAHAVEADGLDNLEVSEWPIQNRPARFGRRTRLNQSA